MKLLRQPLSLKTLRHKVVWRLKHITELLYMKFWRELVQRTLRVWSPWTWLLPVELRQTAEFKALTIQRRECEHQPTFRKVYRIPMTAKQVEVHLRRRERDKEDTRLRRRMTAITATQELVRTA